MNYTSRCAVEYDLKCHYRLRDQYSAELQNRSMYQGCYLKESNTHKGKVYYSVKYAGSKAYKYLGKENGQEVNAIREYAFYKKALEIVETNIIALENFLAVYRITHAEQINELLPRVYTLPSYSRLLLGNKKVGDWVKDMNNGKQKRPVFDPANLKVKAFDGTLMRSRAEAIHHEAFYIYNIPSIFEYPYEIDGNILRPDFSFLDVYSMKTQILEHLGFWFHDNPVKRNRYRAESIERWDEYIKIGFSPEQNLILTFGTDDNTFDIQALHRKIAMFAVPPPSLDTIELLKRC